MRLEYATRIAAQAKADAIHSGLIDNNRAYAGSVAAGQTLRWAFPYQDLDDNGVPINTLWYVNCKERCLGELTAGERTALKPYRT